MRQPPQRPKPPPMRIDQHHLQSPRPIVLRQRQQYRSRQRRLPAPRRPRDQHMPHVRTAQPHQQWPPLLIQPQNRRHLRHLIQPIAQRRQPHHPLLLPRYLHLYHPVLAVHPRRSTAQRHGDLLGQPRHLLDPGPYGRRQLETHEPGSHDASPDPCQYPVAGQHRLDLSRLQLQYLAHGRLLLMILLHNYGTARIQTAGNKRKHVCSVLDFTAHMFCLSNWKKDIAQVLHAPDQVGLGGKSQAHCQS